MNALLSITIDRLFLWLLHRKRSKETHFLLPDTLPMDNRQAAIFYPEPDIPDVTFSAKRTSKESESKEYTFKSQMASGHPLNDECVGDVFLHKGKGHNKHVIIVPGWRMDSLDGLRNRFLKPFSGKGWNVWFFTLPYHLKREPESSLYSGELMVSANIERTLDSVQQMVSDVRALIKWIKRSEDAQVILIGISLGGLLTNLVSTVEPRIDKLISLFYANRLAFSVWNTIPGKYIKSDFESHAFTEEQLNQYWFITDPSRTKPLIPKQNILLFSAKYDQYVNMEDVDRLWEAWDRPQREIYECGHAGLVLYQTRMVKRLISFIEEKASST